MCHLSLLWPALTRKGFILFNYLDTREESQVGYSSEKRQTKLLKSAFILCANIFYGSHLLSLDFYLLTRTTAWVGSMTAEMSVCQFSKLPAPVQADRNDGNGSYFKGKLRGKMINGPEPPSASTPPPRPPRTTLSW